MKSRKVKAVFNIVMFTVAGLLILVTLMFLCGEVGSLFGWYYIPQRAALISTLLCIMWLAAVWIVGCIASNLPATFVKTHKRMMTMVSVVLDIVVSLFIIWGCFSYNLELDVKIEQYDEHIALYVDNTFVRVEVRHPYYMYEENWLFMRMLTEDEMSEACKKYGKPENYYK